MTPKAAEIILATAFGVVFAKELIRSLLLGAATSLKIKGLNGLDKKFMMIPIAKVF